MISPPFNTDIGVEQGSALSAILSALYISPIFHIFEKRIKNLHILVSFLSFVDDGLIISQEKTLEKTNAFLFYSYSIILSFLKQYSLIIKYRKSDVFHFSRSFGLFNPSLLDLTFIRGPILCPKETWKYLGFIFDKKLSFLQHISFYSNKALSTIKSMKILGNSTRELLSLQK